MAEDDLRQREKEYLVTVEARAEAEHQFSVEFLLAKTQEVTDRVAEHMATAKVGKQLRKLQAMEHIARKRLDAS